MNFRKPAGILFAVIALLSLARGFPGLLARAQTASSETRETPSKAVPRDDLQRSVKIYTYTMTAESGPQRGEVLYFYKCWMCHNKYTKSAPPLNNLFQRPRL